MSASLISALILSGAAGIILSVCGHRLNGWRYWVLLLAIILAFQFGRVTP